MPRRRAVRPSTTAASGNPVYETPCPWTGLVLHCYLCGQPTHQIAVYRNCRHTLIQNRQRRLWIPVCPGRCEARAVAQDYLIIVLPKF